MLFFRPFPGQGDRKDHLRTCVGTGAGAKDPLLYWGHNQDRRVYRVEGAEEQGDAESISDRERGIYFEEIPRHGGALKNLKKIAFQVSVHGTRLVTAEDLPTKDEPADLRLALTVTTQDSLNVDQQVITGLHPLSHHPFIVPTPRLLAQRPPSQQHPHKKLEQQVRLHRLRVLHLQLSHL